MTPHCLTTNAQPRNDQLAALLRTAGATVLQRPLHQLSDDAGAVAALQARLAQTPPQWLCCVSPHSATLLAPLWPQIVAAQIPVAVVGLQTARALEKLGVEPRVTALQDSDELANHLWSHGIDGAQIVTVGAADGITAWHEALRKAGASVEPFYTHHRTVVAYDAATWLGDAPLNAVLFTAPSAVTQFLQLCPAPHKHPHLQRARFFPIGPSTARAMAPRLSTADMPAHPSFRALVQCVCG